MKMVLLVVGKTDQDFVETGLNEFCRRLKHYISFEIEVVPDSKNTKNLSFEQQKEKEGESILKSLQAGDYVILLDERGKEFTSLQFAEYLEKKTSVVTKRMVFIIGGAYGFSRKVQNAAHEKIALSKMTFSHQFIRLIFVEQIYRAMTIRANQPYHHE
jgi:23S rRNA (pseudouridine1915-N3)-methyltransferase